MNSKKLEKCGSVDNLSQSFNETKKEAVHRWNVQQKKTFKNALSNYYSGGWTIMKIINNPKEHKNFSLTNNLSRKMPIWKYGLHVVYVTSILCISIFLLQKAKSN